MDSVNTIKDKISAIVSAMDQYLEPIGGAGGAVALTAVAAAATYYYSRQPVPVTPLVDLEQQTVEEGPELIRRSRIPYKGSKDGQYFKYLDDNTKTMFDAFRRGAKLSNNGPCLGWHEDKDKPYQWINYNESLLRAKNFAAGLLATGLKPGQETNVGVYTQNCPEWVLTEQGCYCYNMVIVPLYDTLGEEACTFIINQAIISVVVVDNDTKIATLLGQRPRPLTHIVSTRPVKPELVQRAKDAGVRVSRFTEVEKLGAAANIKETPPKPEDLATICYTSGTTGDPKGVMLTHENLVADVGAVLIQLGECAPDHTDTLISFLPLAHMLERVCETAMYMQGGSVGFFLGDIRALMDDMKHLRPTLMPVVPRLLNRIYDKVWSNVAGSKFKTRMLQWALDAKEAEIKRGIIRNDSFWDRLVLKKVRDSLGGRVRLMVVGSAPMAANVLTFMRAALGCTVLEGYGQTECVAPCTLTLQGDARPDHVGPPLPCCDIKLVDVPEMNYFAASGQGEVCIRGTNVTQGYYKNPEKTRETIDSDGWLHTGDVGQWLPNGTLRIIDRAKHIFKLSQGEYVAPEKVENVYVRSQLIAQMFVHGESLKSCVVAVVVPDVDVLKAWATKNNVPGTLSVLCQSPKVKKHIMDDMNRLAKEANLKSFEQVKDIYLHPDPFSVQNNLLTPTLKAKRPELRKYFKPQLDDLYSKLT
ncbi:long-chain-fatty-acid--CoA ligase 1-like isoform X2 [Amphibalanus amphitrite]|uniref:long-chain-fatty-acid--CoA ligase 1-like isoform X2 n=2 Tax=Amphibalanus amphitrite TaxID=1232801 RepID=UPI001C922379|nr:long-chain-fatty-acid--CoA ligase 1-like isoform X2 [Amphibalanus amphitrite]